MPGQMHCIDARPSLSVPPLGQPMSGLVTHRCSVRAAHHRVPTEAPGDVRRPHVSIVAGIAALIATCWATLDLEGEVPSLSFTQDRAAVDNSSQLNSTSRAAW